MSWAAELKRHGQKAGKKSKPTAPIQETAVMVRRPSGHDPGQCVIAHYVVENGEVTLTDEAGKAIGSPVAHNEHDPKSLAAVLARQKFDEDRGDADFDRPLSFPPDSVA